MRGKLALVVLTSLAAGAPTNALTASGKAMTYRTAGLSVTLPSGWHPIHRRLTPCTNPIERVTVGGRGALVMLQESLDPPQYIKRFRPRPRRFALRGEPQSIACCAPRGSRGWFFDFRDRGRGFYAYVYLGEPGTRHEALSILDSLRVEPRRGS